MCLPSTLVINHVTGDTDGSIGEDEGGVPELAIAIAVIVILLR